MRKPLIALLAGALTLGLASIASGQTAATTTQEVEASISPSKTGTKAKPKAISLRVRTATSNSDGSQPPVVSQADIQFPKELKFNGRSFPTCTQAALNRTKDPSKCPKGSIVGKGSAKGQLGATEVNLTVTAVNGPAGKKIELFVEATGLGIQSAIEGTLTRGNLLKVPIPEELQQPAPGTFASLTEFITTVKAKGKDKNGKTVNYVESTGCDGDSLPVSGTFTLRNGGAPLTASNTISCS